MREVDVIVAGGGSVPALRADVAHGVSPVLSYLARLSPASRTTQRAAARVVATALWPHLEGDARALTDPQRWAALTPEACLAAYARLQGRRAPATLSRFLSALRGIVREAWRLGLIDADHRDRLLDLPTVRARRLPAGRELSEPELAALLNAASGRDAALLSALVGGGLRRDEAARLLPSDIETAQAESRAPATDKRTHPIGGCTLSVTVPTLVRLRVLGKGDKERICYIAGADADRILSWAAGRPAGEPVFGLRSGGGVWKALQRLRREAGVSPFSPHDLRRTFVSRSLDAGIDLVTVQVAVGHADPRTTSRYDRRGERALAAAASVLASQRLTACPESC